MCGTRAEADGHEAQEHKKNWKGKKLADGLPLSGKGRLSEKDIDSLQVYYGKAIRENVDSLDNIRRAVWAIYFHKLSTDAKPQHGLCPKEPSSWCGYNRSLVEGSETYSHKHNIPEAVMDVLKPVFKALSDQALLRKCLHGRTQNTNESLNQLIWCRCPKTTFVSADTVKTATNDAVAYYNDGNSARKQFWKPLELFQVCFVTLPSTGWIKSVLTGQNSMAPSKAKKDDG